MPKGTKLSSSDFSALKSTSEIPAKYQNKKRAADSERRLRGVTALNEALSEIVVHLQFIAYLQMQPTERTMEKAKEEKKILTDEDWEVLVGGTKLKKYTKARSSRYWLTIQ